MFKVKLIKQYGFKVVVRGYSKINSLIVTLVDNTTKISAKLLSIMKSSATIKDGTNIVIQKIKLITNMGQTIKNNKDSINATISSKEKFSNTEITSDTVINNMIKSKEKISTKVVDTLKIICDPSVGYFKKLYEFDNLTLAELDDFTLEEMDYILTLMSSIEQEVI